MLVSRVGQEHKNRSLFGIACQVLVKELRDQRVPEVFGETETKRERKGGRLHMRHTY